MTLFWIIQAYNTEDPLGNLSDVCTLELIAGSKEKALKRAKKLIDKKFYRVHKVIETND